MDSIPSNKIIRLLSILEKNIRDGAKVSPIADPVNKNIIINYNFGLYHLILYNIKFIFIGG